MNIAIIQARTGSSRLPGKIFLPLCDNPLIWHIVNRLRLSRQINKIVISTSINKMDDILEEWALKNNIECFRGSEDDVLSRFYFAAKHFNASVIIRVTADDPFKDPTIIDKVVDLFYQDELDFANNNNPPTFPEGLDTEVFSFNALETAFKQAMDPFEREHVTQYFYRNPSLFKQKCLSNNKDLSKLRWTIDTQDDFEMASIIYNKLYKTKQPFLMNDILDLLDKEPQIASINSKVKRSAMYSRK